MAAADLDRLPALAVQRLEAANLRAATSSSEALKHYLQLEVAKWKEVGKKLKLD